MSNNLTKDLVDLRLLTSAEVTGWAVLRALLANPSPSESPPPPSAAEGPHPER